MILKFSRACNNKKKIAQWSIIDDMDGKNNNNWRDLLNNEVFEENLIA